MHYMSAYIQIGDKGFTRINSAKISSSRKTITDRASVRLANVSSLVDDEKKKIKVGDIVTIALGYNGNNNIYFNGYVSEIKASSPLEIICEDEMWKLKQKTVSKSWESVKLVDVLKYLVPDINVIECPELTLSPYRLVTVTVAKALETIKETYGLDIYFRGTKLFAGIPYTEKSNRTVKYHFQKNLPSKLLQTGLVYKKKEDVKIRVQAVSMLPNNKQIVKYVGDEDGETHTLHFFNLSEKELEQQAKAKIDLLKYDGWRGQLMAFGLPFIKHGDIARLTDDERPNVNGAFFADTVETTYGPEGLFNYVSPGKSAA